MTKPKQYLTSDQLRRWLKDNYPRAVDLASAAGISVTGAKAIMDGYNLPRAQTLEGIGVRVVYEIGK